MASPAIEVQQIVVQGNSRTHEHVITQELRGVLACHSYDEVGEALVEGTQRLRELGIFRSVDVLLDAADGGSASGMVPATVVVKVSELNRLSASTGTYLQNGEGSMEASVTALNALGLAERAELNMTRGHERSNAFRLGLTKPRPFGADCTVQAGARKLLNSRERVASHCEKVQAADVSLSFGDAARPSGSHTLTYELALREACKLTPAASAAIHMRARTSLKSSVRYSVAWDSRDQPWTPTCGSALRAEAELSGLGGLGDERALKVTAEAGTHVFLWESLGLVAGLSLGAGAIVPLRAPATARGGGAAGAGGAYASDRFLLGGVSTVRGFRTNALGPRDTRRELSAAELEAFAAERKAAAASSRFNLSFGPEAAVAVDGHAEEVQAKLPRGRFDALGGELMAHGLVALSAPLPGPFAQHGLRAQVWANGGGLAEWAQLSQDGGANARGCALTFARGLRLTVGVGLVVPTPIGRLELNVCRVLRRQGGDSTSRALQLGLCTHFL